MLEGSETVPNRSLLRNSESMPTTMKNHRNDHGEAKFNTRILHGTTIIKIKERKKLKTCQILRG